MDNSKVYVCVGYGPGIGYGCSLKFGSEGFRVALLCRKLQNLQKGIKLLSNKGISAKGYECDVTNEEQTQLIFKRIIQELGRIDVVHYNPHLWRMEDMFTINKKKLYDWYNIEIVGFIQCIQNSIYCLEQNKGCILVTSGGLSDCKKTQRYSQMYVNGEITSHGVMYGAMKSAQHSLVYGLQPLLRKRNVTIYEIMVDGAVKDSDPMYNKTNIANLFWNAYKHRRFNTDTIHSKI